MDIALEDQLVHKLEHGLKREARTVQDGVIVAGIILLATAKDSVEEASLELFNSGEDIAEVGVARDGQVAIAQLACPRLADELEVALDKALSPKILVGNESQVDSGGEIFEVKLAAEVTEDEIAARGEVLQGSLQIVVKRDARCTLREVVFGTDGQEAQLFVCGNRPDKTLDQIVSAQ